MMTLSERTTTVPTPRYLHLLPPLYRDAIRRRDVSSSGRGMEPLQPGVEREGLTVHELRALMPRLSAAHAAELLPHLEAAMAEANITTPARRAAFLAQVAHESGELRFFEGVVSNLMDEEPEGLGNVHPEDPVRYKARGPLPITGRTNYRAASRALGIDLEREPARVAEAEVGFRVAAWYWYSRDLNRLADVGDFREITRRINGGYNGMARRAEYYRRAFEVLQER
ncbi:glycoside hydrolase family 19 protein [Archangium violaceum]|nr:glycoside hydrolase family 19 protein [Archangium violaceum]